MSESIKAAVRVWQDLGAPIALTGGPGNVTISSMGSANNWEGEYLPTSRSIAVNSRVVHGSADETRVLVHELGHALGLADGSTSFMRGSSPSPSSADLTAINSLPACSPAKTAPEYLCPLQYSDGGCVGGSLTTGDKSRHKVTVPGEYIYDPECKSGARPAGEGCFQWEVHHDYCSGSPDQFPSPGVNADFSGPCAIHDMCLENAGPKGMTRSGLWDFCNNQLNANLVNNCLYEYGKADPRLAACLTTADIYYTVVTANKYYDLIVGA